MRRSKSTLFELLEGGYLRVFDVNLKDLFFKKILGALLGKSRIS